jgi:uncharacterized protein (UPF0332 family)
MSLKQWADNGWLRPHTTSEEEIRKLLGMVERNLKDASENISADWKFSIAYNAALSLCNVLLYAEGYRAAREAHHYRVIQSLRLTLRSEHRTDIEYLEACRRKRNVIEYEVPGAATEENARELIDFVVHFKTIVMEWLNKKHPELLKT